MTPQLQGSTIRVDIAPGELIDKITILQIKQERIRDEAKRQNVSVELAVLSEAAEHHVESSHRLDELQQRLLAVNTELWDIEDEIRICERDGDFGPRFIELALRCLPDE